MPRAVALLALVLAACGGAVHAPPLRSLELVTANARRDDPRLPIIVALHGRGGSPETLAHAFAGFPVPARVVLLEGPVRESGGHAWYTTEWGANGAGEQLRGLVAQVERAVDAVRAAHPGAPRPIVAGFSQGGELVYALVARRPALFAGAVPVAAMLLPHVLPLRVDAGAAPEVLAVHGDHDAVVPLAGDRLTIDALRARGVRAELDVVAGGDHHLMGALERHFWSALVAVLPRTP